MSNPPRFGVWALVHGSRAALQDPAEPYDASWARNKALVLEAERLGFDSVLVAQHTVNPHDHSLDQLEAWTASAALAALTSRIEIIAAIKPYLYHPVVLAKMAQQIEHISGGRFAINLVNAWNRPELERAGIGFAEHDERYAYGREWISVVDALLRGEAVTHRGDNFRIDDYQLRPADPFRARPRIYVGGESEPARSLVAAHGDVWFINGQPYGDVAGLIADVSSRARPPIATVRVRPASSIAARTSGARNSVKTSKQSTRRMAIKAKVVCESVRSPIVVIDQRNVYNDLAFSLTSGEQQWCRVRSLRWRFSRVSRIERDKGSCPARGRDARPFGSG
ncbi:LLM class flavin-dependent oxidoreductase (plasmid) [Paraburkholderia strydomiana]